MTDFPNKMTSLGEVQRIIGLSLSKIQMGRNQRGGLPLHKNLLVATVLNKARDLYMQETMYMNYKMMTGQFGAGPMGGMPNSCLVDHSNMSGREDHEEEMEDTPEHEEYDEDSESDVEDECDITSNNTHHKHNHLNHNHHYHHNVNQLQNSLTSNASMNMGHASPCTSSMAAAMMMRAAAANANSMAAAAAASAASAASSSMGNSTDNENNSGCSTFNALNMNNSAVNSGVVNNCFSQMSPMNMGMHMLQQQQQLQQHQQQQSQVPGGRITNNQMQHSTQQSQFNSMPSHYAGMMPFFHHQQQMLLHHQQQQQLQQQQNQMSNDQGDDDNMNLEQSQEDQHQHAAVAAMASQAAQVQAASLAAAAARAAVVNNVAAAAAAASTAINEEEIQQHKRNSSSSASSTSGSSSSSNDEGFIDEPECDCDTRNFSNTSDVRVPFQYCYHCAPFHPSNGRGPTLVPTPPPTPCTTAASDTSSSVELTEACGLLTSSCSDRDQTENHQSSMKTDSLETSEESQHLTKTSEINTEQCTKLPIKVSEESSTASLDSHLSTAANGRNDTNNNSSNVGETNFTIYDMDSKSTERRSPCEFPATLRGTKRRRISGCETQDSLSMLKEDSETSKSLPIPNKRRRRSDGEDEEEERSSTSSEDGEESLSIKDTSLTLNDSGYHGEFGKNEVSLNMHFHR